MAELRKLSAVVDVTTAAAALGISRSTAYEMIAAGEFPAAVINALRGLLVITSTLINVLDPPAAGQGRVASPVRPAQRTQAFTRTQKVARLPGRSRTATRA